MNNAQMTVKLWAELDENQAENLNGGYYYPSLNVNIAGGVGAFQQNAGDGVQLNVLPIGKAPKKYPYYYY
jgi:hypothetical protein